MRTNILLVVLLILAITVLLGCQANEQTKPAKPQTTVTNENRNTTSDKSLSLVRTISLPADAQRVKRIAISGDGSYVAVIDANSVEDRLHVWSSKDGKQVYSLTPGYGLSDISWNPQKQELAYSGASGEPMSSAAPVRGFGFIDMSAKSRIQRLISSSMRTYLLTGHRMASTL